MPTSPRFLRAPELPPHPRHALVVGTARYDDERFEQLGWVANDVEAMGAVLGDPEIGGCEVTCRVDLDQRALRREISAFLTARGPEDLVVLYLSCHGLLDQKGAFSLAATDTEMDLLHATAVGEVWLREALDDCRSRRQLLILDCCYSGHYVPGTKSTAEGPPPQVEKRFEGPQDGRGRVVLAACRAGQRAHQAAGGGELSAFTAALVEGLRSGAADVTRRGYVDHDEWFEDAERRVRAERPDQNPVRSLWRGEGKLVVARNPRWTVEHATLPDDVVRRVESPVWPDRVAGIELLGSGLRQDRTDGPFVVAAWRQLERMAGEDPSVDVRSRARHWLDTLDSPWTPGPGPEQDEGTGTGTKGTGTTPERTGTTPERTGTTPERTGTTPEGAGTGTEGHPGPPVRWWPPGRRVALAGLAAGLTVLVGAAMALVPDEPGHAGGGTATSAVAAACPKPHGHGALTDAGAQGCVGLLDDPGDQGLVFGQDPQLRALQKTLLTRNAPLDPDDVTIVWFGALTCTRYSTTPATRGWCEDSAGTTQYLAEREQLEALVLAQHRSPGGGRRIHVVIANTGADAEQAQVVADQIIGQRPNFGRLAVISVSDSREQTKGAIETLLAHGVPVITPTMNADHAGPRSVDGTPAPPFVGRAGYLPLPVQNEVYARWVIHGVAAQYPSPTYRQVDVIAYDAQDDTDYYTTSLVDDLSQAAEAITRGGAPVSVRRVRTTVEVVDAVCHPVSRHATVLMFADRWRTFVEFARAVTGRPCRTVDVPLVIGDGSVDRVMGNDAVRHPTSGPDPQLATSNWGLLYFTSGLQCTDLANQGTPEAAELLTQAEHLGQWAGTPGVVDVPCRDPRSTAQLGSHVAPMWDAVALALRVVEVLGPSPYPSALSSPSFTVPLAEGTVTVTAGRVVRGKELLPVWPVCVLDLGSANEGRYRNTCVGPRDRKDLRPGDWLGLGLRALVDAGMAATSPTRGR